MPSGPEHWHCRVRVKRLHNVVALRNAALPVAAADAGEVQAVVHELEDLLREARSGRLRAIAVAEVYRGDWTSYRWARPYKAAAHALCAAIGDLEFEYELARHDAHRSASKPPDGSA